jgi:hypothetical protein
MIVEFIYFRFKQQKYMCYLTYHVMNYTNIYEKIVTESVTCTTPVFVYHFKLNIYKYQIFRSPMAFCQKVMPVTSKVCFFTVFMIEYTLYTFIYIYINIRIYINIYIYIYMYVYIIVFILIYDDMLH